MRLIVINSNSSGNAYILENDREALLIECGVRFEKIKRALGFNLRKVVGAVVSHAHKDHCVAAKDVLGAGIEVLASRGTHEAMGTINHHRASLLESGRRIRVAGFQILPFDIQHDCDEPLGFLINHEETGLILFLTDSYYSAYVFPGLNNIIVECNYSDDIIEERSSTGQLKGFVRDRTISAHMSLNTCKEMLKANNLASVNNIVLIHLSDSNSDSKRFRKEIEDITGKNVHVAIPGMVIDFNKTPF